MVNLNVDRRWKLIATFLFTKYSIESRKEKKETKSKLTVNISSPHPQTLLIGKLQWNYKKKRNFLRCTDYIQRTLPETNSVFDDLNKIFGRKVIRRQEKNPWNQYTSSLCSESEKKKPPIRTTYRISVTK